MPSKSISLRGQQYTLSITEHEPKWGINGRYSGYIFHEGGSQIAHAHGSSVQEVKLALMEKLNERIKSVTNLNTRMIRELQKWEV